MEKQHLARFNSKINPTPTCWIWEGAITDRGYGQFWDGNKMRRAHIISYELSNGPVPTGLELDHICRVRCCVNPEHLDAVTHRENCRRGIGSKTHCINNHEFTPENTQYAGSANRRVCRICLNKRRRGKYQYHPRKPKTHCPQDHPYEGSNILVNSKGHQECRICNRESKRRHQEKKRHSRIT